MNLIKFTIIEKNASFRVLQALNLEKESVMPSHKTDKEALLMVSNGSLIFEINGEENILNHHDFIKIPKGVVHSLTVIESCDLTLIVSA